jgi:hypothetical protein
MIHNQQTPITSVGWKWLKSSAVTGLGNNGLHEYHKMQYEFNANGTQIRFTYVSFLIYPIFILVKKTAMYKINGTITAIQVSKRL